MTALQKLNSSFKAVNKTLWPPDYSLFSAWSALIKPPQTSLSPTTAKRPKTQPQTPHIQASVSHFPSLVTHTYSQVCVVVSWPWPFGRNISCFTSSELNCCHWSPKLPRRSFLLWTMHRHHCQLQFRPSGCVWQTAEGKHLLTLSPKCKRSGRLMFAGAQKH